MNHFRKGSIQGKLKEIDSWVRNRLRYCIWHDWKKPDRKRENLIRLGIPKGQAYAWSRTRMGGWAVAQSPILVTTITLKRLVQRGYEPMLSYYKKYPHNLMNRCIRDPYVQWCESLSRLALDSRAGYSIVASWVSAR
ncbi:MAG: group II intron maturase-specific domain-containing protein [Flammeovirgaceae bacterium]